MPRFESETFRPPARAGSGDDGEHSAPHATGRPVSRLTPLWDGPRQCGQFSATLSGAAEEREEDGQ